MSSLDKKIITVTTTVEGYRSLKGFEWHNIPDFAVISGLNGSGKTQILEVMSGKNNSTTHNKPKLETTNIAYKNDAKVKVYYIDISYNPSMEKYSATESATMNYTASNNNSNMGQQRPSKSVLVDKENDLDATIIKRLEEKCINYIEDRKEAKNINNTQVEVSLKDKTTETISREYKMPIEEVCSKFNHIINSYKQNSNGFVIIKSILELIEYAIQSPKTQTKYNGDINLEDTLSRLFVIFHKCKKDLKEMINRYQESDKITDIERTELLTVIDVKFSDDKHPCNLINNVLRQYREEYKGQFNLKYDIAYNKTEAIDKGIGNLSLIDILTNETRDFNHLSSGEKVIISLLIKFFTIPKLDCIDVILIDEFDARLNPQMASMYVNIMYKTFYKEYRKQIILTTHSPSTVAYVLEEDLFWMEEGRILDGQDRKEKMWIIHKLATGFVSEDSSCPFMSYLVDPTKPYYILVEGYTDVLHIKNACKKLGGDYEKHILNKCNFINLGGTKEIYAKSFISNFAHGKKVITILDYDKSGVDLHKDIFDNEYEGGRTKAGIKQHKKDIVGILLKSENTTDYQKQIDFGYVPIELMYPKSILEEFDVGNAGFLRNIDNIKDLQVFYATCGMASNIDGCFVIQKDKLKLAFANHIPTLDVNHFDGFKPTLDLVLAIINNWNK